ncbi:MAG: NUDIX domain-containing protein [Candidatus Kapaibacteriota bacterium]
MLQKYSKLKETTVEQNPFWAYKIDDYLLPNGKIEKYYYAHTPGSTMIIPCFENKFVFTLQYRYLNQKQSIEFPGGGAKPELSPLENAKKELLEETGFKANSIEPIGFFNPCNGLTDEICYVFFAKDLIQKEQRLDDSEEIDILFLSEQEIIHKIKSGEIWDGMTLASWCLFKSLHLLY